MAKKLKNDPDYKPRFVRSTWVLYYLFTYGPDFPKIYGKAWCSKDAAPRMVKIFLGRQHIDIPIPPITHDLDDAKVFERARMFYRSLKANEGISEVITPKQLIRIDWVEVCGRARRVNPFCIHNF